MLTGAGTGSVLSRRFSGLLKNISIVLAALALTSTSAEGEGIIMVKVFPLEPGESGAEVPAVEAMGPTLLKCLKRQLKNLEGKDRYKARYRITEGDRFPDVTLTIDKEVVIRSLYHSIPPRYQVRSTFEAEGLDRVSIIRDCEDAGGKLRCHLDQVANFHVRLLQRLKTKRGRQPKRFFLKYTERVSSPAGGGLACGKESGSSWPPNLRMKGTLENLLRELGWVQVHADCYADYVINVEARYGQDWLFLETMINNKNILGVPGSRSFRFNKGSFCSFVSALNNSYNREWIRLFHNWFKQEEIRWLEETK